MRLNDRLRAQVDMPEREKLDIMQTGVRKEGAPPRATRWEKQVKSVGSKPIKSGSQSATAVRQHVTTDHLSAAPVEIDACSLVKLMDFVDEPSANLIRELLRRHHEMEKVVDDQPPLVEEAERYQFPILGASNLIFGEQLPEIMIGEEVWEDVEFEVALDSGCTDHIAAEVDTPGYELEDSPGSRAGQAFIIGDGGRLPNKGQKRLRLETTGENKNTIDSIFQIARVARPLMSVGRICDNDNEITFKKTVAIVREEATGDEICRFHRPDGGLYVAKLMLKRPRPPPFQRPA